MHGAAEKTVTAPPLPTRGRPWPIWRLHTEPYQGTGRAAPCALRRTNMQKLRAAGEVIASVWMGVAVFRRSVCCDDLWSEETYRGERSHSSDTRSVDGPIGGTAIQFGEDVIGHVFQVENRTMTNKGGLWFTTESREPCGDVGASGRPLQKELCALCYAGASLASPGPPLPR
jgi:hypothetical protein